MVKNPTQEQLETLKLNVYLKDGREFLGCDVPQNPFGDGASMKGVSFWQEESLYYIPMSEVREVVIVFE
jgi:hypothetical protein